MDNADSIPLEIELGRNSFGTNQKKNYFSVLVDSENARGAKLQYSIDGGPFNTFKEQIDGPVTLMTFKQGGQMIEGRDINYKLVHSDSGDPLTINGLTTFFSIIETIPDGTR